MLIFLEKFCWSFLNCGFILSDLLSEFTWFGKFSNLNIYLTLFSPAGVAESSNRHNGASLANPPLNIREETAAPQHGLAVPGEKTENTLDDSGTFLPPIL